MAIQWGSWSNHVRVGIDLSYSPPVKAGTSSVTVTAKLYFATESGWWNQWNSNNNVTLGGRWSSSSPRTIAINNPGGVSQLIYTWTQNVSLTGSSQTLTFSSSVQHAGGTNSTGNKTISIPARVPAPPAPTLTLSSATFDGFTASWTQSGSSISNRRIRYSTNSNMSGATTKNGNTPMTVTGLSPDTTYYVQAANYNGSGWSSWSATKSISTLGPPPKPTLTLSNPSINGFRATWTTSGTSVNGWEVQTSTSANMSSPTVYSGQPPRTFTDKNPGTTYYVQARNENGGGWSDWSDVESIATLPSSPPTLDLSGNPAGTQVTATMSSSGSPDVYHVEWQYLSPGSGNNGSRSGGNVQTVTGLTPGATYQFRAWVEIGSYTSPKSSWQQFTMNDPGTLSGDYFDGSFASKSDVDYSWTGTAHGSTSIAEAHPAKGWVQTSDMVQYRATGSLISGSGSYLARYVALDEVDLSTVLMGVGDSTGRIDVSDAIPYFGRISVSPSETADLRAVLRWLDSGGSTISTDQGSLVTVAGGDIDRLTVTATSPANAAYAELYVSGSGNIDMGVRIDLDGAIFSVGDPTSYFDGDFPDTSSNLYEWDGAANESISINTPLSGGSSDPFEDPTCVLPPAPPRPPEIDNPCIEEIGVWRRYWAEIPAAEVSEYLDVLPTFTITTGGLDAGQVRVRIWPNPDNLSPDAFDSSDGWISEQTISYVPANSEVVLDSLSERAFGRVNAEWQDINHLLYGVGGRPATWPVLSCGISYLVAFDMPIDAPAGNVDITAALTIREG